jgi:hypothetical protein
MPEPREPMMAMMSMMGLYEELDWLRDHDALPGVMAVMHARRAQIEAGYTVAHDREHHEDGRLVRMAAVEADEALRGTAAGMMSGHDVISRMTEAAALAAAEIDRLTAEQREHLDDLADESADRRRLVE